MRALQNSGIILSALALLNIVSVVGCGPQAGQQPQSQTVVAARDLADARSRFATKLKWRGPAPQDYQSVEPPAGVREVEYSSGDLKLKGWLSAQLNDGKRHPAVVFLHGGWAFAPVCWQDAEPFVAAGFVLFMPRLRAENGNPGAYEGFYGEVDDAVAAGRFVASLPDVDPERVFVAGHSVGAVLTVLAAMVPSPYKRGAALSGYLDMELWAKMTEEAERVIFDANDAEEIRLRNPMAFAPSLRIPLTLYFEPEMGSVNRPFADLAHEAGKECQLVAIPGNHQTMVVPSVQEAIREFRSYAVK
jgi:dipeptidyl aminopeptidase/acylaminoacyl peptidase